MALTFELLYELCRKEKAQPELQLLSTGFCADIAQYIDEKERSLQQSQQSDPFGQAAKLATQLSSAKRLSRELFERRARKIADMALNKVRNAVVATAGLLPAETVLFDELCAALRGYHDRIATETGPSAAHGAKTASQAQSQQPAPSPTPSTPLTPTTPTTSSTQSTSTPSAPSSYPTAAAEQQPQEQEQHPEPSSSHPSGAEQKRVKFVKEVPAFVGKELEEYGPFTSGAEAELPEAIAQLLITNGQAVESEGTATH